MKINFLQDRLFFCFAESRFQYIIAYFWRAFFAPTGPCKVGMLILKIIYGTSINDNQTRSTLGH